MTLSFYVLGEPITQGSKTARVNPRLMVAQMREAREATLRPWRLAVARAAFEARGETPPIKGPVEVRLTFHVARPKSYPKKVRLPFISNRYDIDKLARAVLDAMTDAGVYGDDGQVVDLYSCKRFATDTRGVYVEVIALDDTPTIKVSDAAELPLFSPTWAETVTTGGYL